ncbi:MAG: hypothetical protein C5B60_02425 [Chloroflexi bacterium]|nr:MAG: hypothetical protein C5B60_02425 [Chloroflexota bacterium]
MPPDNEFLVFGTGAGANVVSPGDWAVDPERITGFSQGLARSSKANTVWRQTSSMTAALAALIIERTNRDMRDNGDVNALIAALRETFESFNPRELVEEPTRQYFVSEAGNNNNNGRTSGSAWRDIQYGVDFITDRLDFNHNQIILNVADGQNYQGFTLAGSPQGIQVPSHFLIRGNLANPSAVLVTGVSPGETAVSCGLGAMVTLEGMTLTAPNAGGVGLSVYRGSNAWFRLIDFAQCVAGHITGYDGAIINPIGPYRITGSADRHYLLDGGSSVAIYPGGTSVSVTLSGLPGFSDAFVAVANHSTLSAINLNFVGPATGRRHAINNLSLIHTNSGNINYFPGDQPGIPASIGVMTGNGGLFVS